MATLTNADFVKIRLLVQAHPAEKTILKTWHLPKATWQTALQTIEDYMVNGFGTRPATSIRAAIEAVTGATTVQRATTLLTVYFWWKVGT